MKIKLSGSSEKPFAVKPSVIEFSATLSEDNTTTKVKKTEIKTGGGDEQKSINFGSSTRSKLRRCKAGSKCGARKGLIKQRRKRKTTTPPSTADLDIMSDRPRYHRY